MTHTDAAHVALEAGHDSDVIVDVMSGNRPSVIDGDFAAVSFN